MWVRGLVGGSGDVGWEKLFVYCVVVFGLYLSGCVVCFFCVLIFSLFVGKVCYILCWVKFEVFLVSVFLCVEWRRYYGV